MFDYVSKNSTVVVSNQWMCLLDWPLFFDGETSGTRRKRWEWEVFCKSTCFGDSFVCHEL